MTATNSPSFLDVIEAVVAYNHKQQGKWHIQIFEDEVKSIFTLIVSSGIIISQGTKNANPLIEHSLTDL